MPLQMSVARALLLIPVMCLLTGSPALIFYSLPVSTVRTWNLPSLLDGSLQKRDHMLPTTWLRSTSIFDQDIGEPNIYNNYGRYPIIIANSCFTGDIFGGGTTKSEQFVLIPGKGSIAYLASTAIGYSDDLNTYTNELYINISTRM